MLESQITQKFTANTSYEAQLMIRPESESHTFTSHFLIANLCHQNYDMMLVLPVIYFKMIQPQ